MLGAVDVPGLDLEDDGALRLCLVSGIGQASEQLGIVLHHPRPAPQLDALAAGVVHQEDGGAGRVGLSRYARRSALDRPGGAEGGGQRLAQPGDARPEVVELAGRAQALGGLEGSERWTPIVGQLGDVC